MQLQVINIHGVDWNSTVVVYWAACCWCRLCERARGHQATSGGCRWRHYDAVGVASCRSLLGGRRSHWSHHLSGSHEGITGTQPGICLIIIIIINNNNNAVLQYCPFAWQFAGYRLHRLMIVPNFVFLNFLNSSGIMCTEGLKNYYNYYARQHMCYRPSVRLSVFCPSDGWIIQKWLKIGLWNFHYTVAPSL